MSIKTNTDSQYKSQRIQTDVKQTIGTALTLANTMMGAALLSLPFTFSRLGWVIALLISVFAFFFSYFGFDALIDASHYTQCKTMRGMISQIFGKVISTVIDACIAFMYCGFLVSYVSICGDYIQIFIKAVFKDEVKLWIVKACLVVVLAPLTMLSSTAALSNISAFAIIFIFITVVSVMVFFFIGLNKSTGLKMQVANGKSYGIYKYDISDLEYSKMWKPTHTKGGYAFLEVIQRIPLFMPLFGCHASVPVLLHDLQGQPQYKRQLMKNSIKMAIITVYVLYLVNALCAYFLFGKNIAGNVLVSFIPTNYVMSAVRLCYAFVIILSFVVIVYPIRSIFMEWMNLDFTSKKGKMVFYIIGILLSIFAIVVSIAVPDIVTVFNAVSALFGIAVYWVIPIICRWKNPELQAKSIVPLVDNVEQQRKDTIAIRKQSLVRQYVSQTQKIDCGWFLKQDRVRTRSEVAHNLFMEEQRKRSQTLVTVDSHQHVVENMMQKNEKRSINLEEVDKSLENQQQTSGNSLNTSSIKKYASNDNITGNVQNKTDEQMELHNLQQSQNTDFEKIENDKRYRSHSIAEQNPARLNQFVAEELNQTETSKLQSKETPMPKTNNDLDDVVIAAAAAAQEADTQVKEVEIQGVESPENKKKLMSRMTKSRFTIMLICSIFVICLNLMAFVLTTFFDMSTSRFTKYDGYPDYPKKPNA